MYRSSRNSLEHAERAAAALRLAQDALDTYLTVLGLGHDGDRAPDGDWRAGLTPQEPPAPGTDADTAPPVERLGPWWQARIAAAHRRRRRPPGRAGRAQPAGPPTPPNCCAGSPPGCAPATGPGSAATCTPSTRPPGSTCPRSPRRCCAGSPVTCSATNHAPQDLPRLQGAASDRVRALLPGTPPALVDTLLARICRAPAAATVPAHPADSAVTAGVLTGVLLARLGRDPATLDPAAPEPLRPRTDTPHESNA